MLGPNGEQGMNSIAGRAQAKPGGRERGNREGHHCDWFGLTPWHTSTSLEEPKLSRKDLVLGDLGSWQWIPSRVAMYPFQG